MACEFDPHTFLQTLVIFMARCDNGSRPDLKSGAPLRGLGVQVSLSPPILEDIMAYRFNSGRGGVTCDVCNILYDSDLSFKEYEESYGKSGNDGDICWECMAGGKKKKSPPKKFDLMGRSIVDDGWRN